ncbi:uncharacterized protein RBU33_028421 [Hipposideros larvatus]
MKEKSSRIRLGTAAKSSSPDFEFRKRDCPPDPKACSPCDCDKEGDEVTQRDVRTYKPCGSSRKVEDHWCKTLMKHDCQRGSQLLQEELKGMEFLSGCSTKDEGTKSRSFSLQALDQSSWPSRVFATGIDQAIT